MHQSQQGVLSHSPPAHAIAPMLNTQLGAPPTTANVVPTATARARSLSTTGGNPSTSNPSSQNVRRMVSDWIVEGRIGHGSFATVWRGFHKETGQLAAIKSISKEKIMVNKKHQENLDMEIMIMSRITHPNIVKLFEVKETPRHKYLILEYLSGGDLSKFIRKHGAMSEKHAKVFLGQLAAGLKFLRQANLIHRDLKPQNLLLDSDSPDAVLKIADFGFARYMEPNNLAATLCGSPLYMAPEILGYKEYDASVDLWSVGGILFEMVTGKPPFTGANHIQLLNRINTTEVKFPVGLELSQSCVSLLLGLLKRNPRERMSFDQFFSHPFVVEAMQLAQALLKKHQLQQSQPQQPTAAATPTPSNDAQQQPHHSSSSQQAQPSHLVQPPTTSDSLSPSPTAATTATSNPNAIRPLQANNIPLSSTPPNPQSMTPQQQQQLTLQQQQQLYSQQQRPQPSSTNNSQLYGSSPSQTGFMQQQPALLQQPQQQQFNSPQPIPAQRYSPNTMHHIPSGSSPSPSPAFLPTQHNHAQHQTYQKPPQQVGFNAPQQQPSPQQQQQLAQAFSPPSPANPYLNHSPSSQQQQLQAQAQNRPISRHNTPQYLRASGDGSASLEREFVFIDGDANSQSGLNREQQSPVNTALQHHSPHLSQQQQPQPQQQSSSVEWNEAAEKSRLTEAIKRAHSVAKGGDLKLTALGNYFASHQTQAAQHIISSLLQEWGLFGDETMSTIATSTIQTPSTPVHQLTTVLAIYVTACDQFKVINEIEMPRILHALADHMSRVHDTNMQTEWGAIQNYFLDLKDQYWQKCLRVKEAIKELEALNSNPNTVRLAPPTTVASSLSHSRPGSVTDIGSSQTVPNPGLNSLSNSRVDDKSSLGVTSSVGELKEGGLDASLSNKNSPALNPQPQPQPQPQPSITARLGMLSIPCVEKQLFDQALELCNLGGHDEYVNDLSESKKKLNQAIKIFETLIQHEKAVESDKIILTKLMQMTRESLARVIKSQKQATSTLSSHPHVLSATSSDSTVQIHSITPTHHQIVSVN